MPSDIRILKPATVHGYARGEQRVTGAQQRRECSGKKHLKIIPRQPSGKINQCRRAKDDTERVFSAGQKEQCDGSQNYKNRQRNRSKGEIAVREGLQTVPHAQKDRDDFIKEPEGENTTNSSIIFILRGHELLGIWFRHVQHSLRCAL